MRMADVESSCHLTSLMLPVLFFLTDSPNNKMSFIVCCRIFLQETLQVLRWSINRYQTSNNVFLLDEFVAAVWLFRYWKIAPLPPLCRYPASSTAVVSFGPDQIDSLIDRICFLLVLRCRRLKSRRGAQKHWCFNRAVERIHRQTGDMFLSSSAPKHLYLFCLPTLISSLLILNGSHSCFINLSVCAQHNWTELHRLGVLLNPPCLMVKTFNGKRI